MSVNGAHATCFTPCASCQNGIPRVAWRVRRHSSVPVRHRRKDTFDIGQVKKGRFRHPTRLPDGQISGFTDDYRRRHNETQGRFPESTDRARSGRRSGGSPDRRRGEDVTRDGISSGIRPDTRRPIRSLFGNIVGIRDNHRFSLAFVLNCTGSFCPN